MISKPLAIAYKPFRSMEKNTSKERSFYTQGHQFVARVLFIVWLLASVSPEGTLATPKRQMVPATTTSPQGSSLVSTPPTPPPGGILQLPPDSPGSLWGNSVASSPAIDAALQRQPAASLCARTIGKLTSRFWSPRTQEALRTPAGPVAEGDEAGSSSAVVASSTAAPSALQQLMRQEGVPDNKALVAALDAAPPEEQRPWIEAAIQWFATQPIETLSPAAIQDYAALSHIRVNSEHRELLERYLHSLCRKVKDGSFGEKPLIQALAYSLEHLDPTIFTNDSTSLFRLADNLLEKLKQSKNAFTKRTYPTDRATLEALCQTLSLAEKMEPGQLDKQAGSLYQNFSNQLQELAQASYYPISYHAQFLEQALELLAKTEESSQRQQVWKGCQAVFHGLEGGLYFYQGINKLIPFSSLEVLSNFSTIPFKSSYSAFTKSYAIIKEILPKSKSDENDWYNNLLKMCDRCAKILQEDTSRCDFLESYLNIQKLRVAVTKGEKALRFGLVLQLQLLALSGPTPEVRTRIIGQLQTLAQPASWGADADVMAGLLDSLALVAVQSQAERASEAAMASEALEGLTAEASAFQWLAEQTLDDKLQHFRDQFTAQRETAGQGDMFRHVKKKLPNPTQRSISPCRLVKFAAAVVPLLGVYFLQASKQSGESMGVQPYSEQQICTSPQAFQPTCPLMLMPWDQGSCTPLDPEKASQQYSPQMPEFYVSISVPEVRQALKAHYQERFSEVPSFFPEEPRTPMSQIQCHLMLLEQVKVKEAPQEAKENQLLAIHERIEWRKSPIALCDLFKKRSIKPDGPIEEISKVLLIGEAGTGKTTLSRKIAHDWAQGAWGAGFTAIYLLPVRNLQQGKYNGATFRTESSLATAIVQECFPAECRGKDKDFERLRDQVQEELKQPTTLVILDGLDERQGAREEILSEAGRGVHKLLLLSRPYGVVHERQMVELEVEHQGFNDAQVDAYVQDYFRQLDKPASTSTELLTFIKKYPAPKAISHIPVNLGILCALWLTDSDGVRAATMQGSLPGLYRRLTSHIWERFLTRWHPNDPQAQESANEQWRPKVFAALGKVALGSLEQGLVQISDDQVLISGERVRDILEESGIRVDILKASGFLFLRSAGREQYQFPHLTFQEYFAGRALAERFLSKDEDDQERVSDFFSEHKYESQYGRTLSFMAGEVSRKKGAKGIKRLLSLLGEGDQEGVRLQHLLLQLRVIHEWLCIASEQEAKKGMAELEQKFQVMASLKEWFGKGLEQVRREGYGPASPGGRLLGLLTESLQVFRSVLRQAPGVLDMLQQYAKYKEADVLGGYPVRQAAVETLGQVISVISSESSAILATLREAAKDENHSVHKAAFRSLVKVLAAVPGDSVTILATLHEAAKDGDYNFRQAPVEALGQALSVIPSESDAILATLHEAAKDKGWDVRQASVEALGQALSVIPGESDAILATLREAAKDGDYHVRQASVEALGQALSVVPGESGAILATLQEAAKDEYKDWQGNYPVREAASKFLNPSMDSVAANASNRPAPQSNPQRFTGLLKTEASQIEQTLHTYKLGKEIWELYYGAVGEEPALPAYIEEEKMMNSPCPFWPGHKLKETHLLVLIPSHVGGQPLTLNYLAELIQSPQGEGHGTKYGYYWDEVREAIGSQSPGRSYWVLMTRGVLPGSRNKRYEDQHKLVVAHANRTGLPYEVPGALEAAVVMLLHHVRSGEFLYGLDPLTYTRCQEKVQNFQLVVGGFSSGGLYVNFLNFYDNSYGGDYGVAGLRKF